jgi:alkylation response protein AidB-like acyl-CoA dehydrogenase
VWTSGGQVADLGMLIARTDPDVPKHQGITYFGIDMHQKGIDIRPLVEMTGHAMFNEVFLEEAVVPDSALIGGLNNGWAVANTTLMNERAGLGSGGGHAAASAATPGTVVNDLVKRAGDFVSSGGAPKRRSGGGGGGGMFGSAYKVLVELAKGNGKIADPTIRQDLMKLHTLNELGRFNNLRAKAAKAIGQDVPGLPNISKLSMSEIVRQQRDIGLRIIGPYGTLHAYKPEQQETLNAATGNPFTAMVTGLSLFAQAPPIYGGTDQVQKNIIGERVLGLPKEANNDKTAAFKDLPKNA